MQHGVCKWCSHMYSNFFVGHLNPVQQVCSWIQSAWLFGRQPQSTVVKIGQNWRFCCVWPTSSGHRSLDTLSHCPSLLFCTIFFPLFPRPWWPSKVAWVKIGQKPYKKTIFVRWPQPKKKFSSLKKWHGSVSGMCRSGLLACRLGHCCPPKTVFLDGFLPILTQATLECHHGQGKSGEKMCKLE